MVFKIHYAQQLKRKIKNKRTRNKIIMHSIARHCNCNSNSNSSNNNSNSKTKSNSSNNNSNNNDNDK